MYAFALERAREPGAQTLETVVLATNEDGLRCAQRHGFAEFDRYVLPGDTVAFVALRRGSEEVRAGYRAAWGASPARPHVRDSMDGLGVARAMGRLDVVTAALGTGPLDLNPTSTPSVGAMTGRKPGRGGETGRGSQ